ncbi:MAG: DUF3047 domain-containing protein [Gemmatimonadales bacterium]
MTSTALLFLQALTTLDAAPLGPGLPEGWELQRVRGHAPPAFAVRDGHRLRIASDGGAGFAVYRLRESLPPGRGVLTWEWSTGTPMRQADLRRRERDDAPVRLFVAFEDGRTLFYSWGNRERPGEHFPSWTGGGRAVVVLRNAGHADGSWYAERRDPFADYLTAFDHAPVAIVAVGVGADMDMLDGSSAAEVRHLAWEPLGN